MKNSDFLTTLESYQNFISNVPIIDLSLNSANTAIVVIDMVNGFCKFGALASDRLKNLIAPTRSFLAKFDKATKYFVCDFHNENSLEFKTFPKHCNGDEESAVVEELHQFLGTIVRKNSTNGFFNFKPHFNSDMQNIILCGDCTDICVLQFGLTLKSFCNENNLNTNILLNVSCVDTFDSPTHNADLLNTVSLKLLSDSGLVLVKN